MLYYTFEEVLRGAAYSVLFGALCCAVSLTVDALFEFIFALLRYPSNIVRFSGSITSIRSYLSEKINFSKTNNKYGIFLSDFIFCCITGFLVSLLFYLASDGEIRLYTFLIFLLSYKLCKKSLGKWIYIAIQGVLKFIFKLVTSLSLFAVFPVRFLIGKAVMLVKSSSVLKKHKDRKINNCAK